MKTSWKLIVLTSIAAFSFSLANATNSHEMESISTCLKKVNANGLEFSSPKVYSAKIDEQMNHCFDSMNKK